MSSLASIFYIGIYQNFNHWKRYVVVGEIYTVTSTHACNSRLEFDRPSCRRFKQCLQEISRCSNFGFSENGVGFLPQLSPDKVRHVTPV